MAPLTRLGPRHPTTPSHQSHPNWPLLLSSGLDTTVTKVQDLSVSPLSPGAGQCPSPFFPTPQSQLCPGLSLAHVPTSCLPVFPSSAHMPTELVLTLFQAFQAFLKLALTSLAQVPILFPASLTLLLECTSGSLCLEYLSPNLSL